MRWAVRETCPVTQTTLDHVAVGSLAVAIASFVASCISAVIAGQSRRDAERIAERAHDEWAQQKWFDLYFATSSAYDAMDKLQADCVVQGGRIISVRGGESYLDRANELIVLFRDIHAMAMVFPKSATIDRLSSATSGFVNDPTEMLSKQRLQNLMNAMNDIREKALVNSSVLTRVIK